MDKEVIKIVKFDEVHNTILCDASVAHEIQDYFTFTVPGYKFMPAYRSGRWDGKLRLFSPFQKKLYSGLLWKMAEFAKLREYDLDIDEQLLPNPFSFQEARDFASNLGLPDHIENRDHQISGFATCVRNGRALLLSPTSSGKSLIIYMLTRYYGLKTLVITPSTGLVGQMKGDFAEYGLNPDFVHAVKAGVEKESSKDIWVSTWQSLYKMPESWFDQFGVIIVDEAHLAKAKSITGIMEKSKNTPYKFGFTGTLDGSQTHELVLTGLFGPVRKVITTQEMIEKKYAAELNIKCLVLSWGEEDKKAVSKMNYQDEMSWIVTNPRRNNFIKNLALSLDGNVLILYQYVDKQGKVLKDLIESSTDRPVFYIDGKVDGDDRNEIRAAVDSSDNTITIASFGTSSTGMSVKNFNYLIFASPSKGRIRNLQSIGRILRVSKKKNKAVLYDISDDLCWKSKKNHTFNHFKERLKQYDEEKHPYKIYPVSMEKNK